MVMLDYSEQLKKAYDDAIRSLEPDIVRQAKCDLDNPSDLKGFFQGYMMAMFIRNITEMRFLNLQPPGPDTKEYYDYVQKLLNHPALSRLDSL